MIMLAGADTGGGGGGGGVGPPLFFNNIIIFIIMTDHVLNTSESRYYNMVSLQGRIQGGVWGLALLFNNTFFSPRRRIHLFIYFTERQVIILLQ